MHTHAFRKPLLSSPNAQIRETPFWQVTTPRRTRSTARSGGRVTFADIVAFPILLFSSSECPPPCKLPSRPALAPARKLFAPSGWSKRAIGI